MNSSMRILFVLLILLPVFTFAQEPGPQDPDQGGRLENPVTMEQILALPRRNWKPKVTLKQALQIAEHYIKKTELDVSSGYLFEARLISEDRRKSHWQFWWVMTNGRDFRITVSMNGDPQLLRS